MTPQNPDNIPFLTACLWVFHVFLDKQSPKDDGKTAPLTYPYAKEAPVSKGTGANSYVICF